MIRLRLEKIFCLASVAALGLTAVAFAQTVKADSEMPAKIETSAKHVKTEDEMLNDEIETIRQVNEMNAHAESQFNTNELREALSKATGEIETDQQ